MADSTSALDYVLASSSQLTTLALAVAGTSVAAVVSTSYRRPHQLKWRYPFLLFIPGWACIAYSLYSGNQLVGSYLASKMAPGQLATISSRVNDLYADQRNFLLYSLVFFAVWLIVYLTIWTFADEFGGEKK